MIYSISGKLIIKKPQFAVVEASGIGFKILISNRTFRQLPKIGKGVKLFSHLHIYDSNAEIYGFSEERELEIFELLISINGIGPKAGLKILGVLKADNLLAAVKGGRSDLLVKAAGVGAKKANRIVLELKDKIGREIKLGKADDIETDLKLEEILRSLGYKKAEIEIAAKNINPKLKTLEERLKATLKNLSTK